MTFNRLLVFNTRVMPEQMTYLDQSLTFPTESARHIVHTLFMAYEATCTESATDYITEEP